MKGKNFIALVCVGILILSTFPSVVSYQTASSQIKEKFNKFKGTIEISWDNLRGQNVRFELWLFNFSVHHPPVIFCGIDWIHFPYPIMSLAITVKAVDIIVTRSGIEIGPFVMFNQGED